MNSNYKQAVQIGTNVTDIMRLPCVEGCHKLNGPATASADATAVAYTLYADTITGQYRHANPPTALATDWLCQDRDDRWHLLTDREYQETINNKR